MSFSIYAISFLVKSQPVAAQQAQQTFHIVLAFKDAGMGLPDPDVRMLMPRPPDKWRTALGLGDSDRTQDSDNPSR
ncbi:hypothetical protein NDI40_14295 [Microcoleus vaginatus ZQ-A3]|uniref:hypothetical protein n=1 Tax=Microcoleus vaginatus TaxID=119532 RepID=UPI00168931B5|nr:hypothetical protein [Microcoleus sp. FACHB-45]